MTRMRVGLTALLCGILVVSGCGRSADDRAPDAAGTIGSGPATGTVTMWAQGAEAEKLPELLTEFKAANPDVTVKVTAVPWGAAHDKYQTAIAASTTPDIGQMGTTWMGEFAAADAFAPTPTDLDTGDFYAGSVKSTTVDGITYGVPWYVDTPVLYYRTDLAARAGATAPPTTWDEFKALARAYQTGAGSAFGVGLAPKDFQGFLPFAWSNGASLTTEDGTAWTLDTPEMVEALRFYQSFFAEGIANRTPSTDTGAYHQAFVDGSVPMFIGGPFEVGALREAGGPDFAGKYATAVLPKGRSSTSFVGGSDLVVFEQAKNPTAAWKLIQFLTRPSTQVTWYTMTGDLPSVQEAWSDPALRDDTKLAVFGQQLESVDAPPSTTQWAQVQSSGNTQMELVTVTGLDPAAAASTLQEFATSIGTGS
ncbi:MAG: sugar ABC transporter substrate-binding protein [Dactylosporangium sp.]|nr:sugar ABC transporter substrate-binding protein [Dactylosporangium sp.]NNJ59417.1 sugar ABC transporter substrate-binding protein [Dactylosporangium sp.]